MRRSLALIEDDPVQRRLYSIQLSANTGAQVTTFCSGNEFLEAAELGGDAWASSFDVIVVDYLMPGLNGLETISLLKGKLNPSCVICLLSGEIEAMSVLVDQSVEVHIISKSRKACAEILDTLRENTDFQHSPSAAEAVCCEQLLQQALLTGLPGFSYGLLWKWNPATEAAFQAFQSSRRRPALMFSVGVISMAVMLAAAENHSTIKALFTILSLVAVTFVTTKTQWFHQLVCGQNSVALLYFQCMAISLLSFCGFFCGGLMHPVFNENSSFYLQWHAAPSAVILDVGLVYCTLLTSWLSMPTWLVSLFPLIASSVSLAVDSSNAHRVVGASMALMVPATMILFDARQSFASQAALVHRAQVKCRDMTRMTVLTRNQEHQRQLKATEENTLGVLNHCAKRVLSENVEWIDLWKQEFENTQFQPGGSDAFLQHTNEVLCFLAKENQKGYNKCKGAVMSQQIKSGSCRASLEPCNVGAWLQHKINHRADTELRIDPAVPESVELDEALCDVILDRAVDHAQRSLSKGGVVLIHATFTEVGSLLKIRVVATPSQESHNEQQVTSSEDAQLRVVVSGFDDADMRDISMVAKSIGATIDLDTESASVVFTLELKVDVSDESRSLALPPEVRLVCADDDPMARRICEKVLPNSLNIVKENCKILGENYEEVQGLADTVLMEAQAYGDANVVCIFDQNMDRYSEGQVYGTDVTADLRSRGFDGLIFIRSANDTYADETAHRFAGANGTLSKSWRTKVTARRIQDRWQKWNLRS